MQFNYLKPLVVAALTLSACAAAAAPGLAVKPIVSSCCGMAGSFGYQAETQDVSKAMAEAGLVPWADFGIRHTVRLESPRLWW